MLDLNSDLLLNVSNIAIRAGSEIMKFYSGDPEIFTKKDNSKKSVVLVEYPRKGSWAVGFATKDNSGEISDKTKQKLVNDTKKVDGNTNLDQSLGVYNN